MATLQDSDSNVNLSALQRVDPYITEIVDSATQVALYRFIASDDLWDKTEVEGALFVYIRSAPPYYGFIIMNRLSKTNQVEPITKDLELQREDPYLLYRNSKLNIYGIWFYDRDECAKISNSTASLLQREKTGSKHQQKEAPPVRADSKRNRRNPSKQVGENTADILSMLTVAQETYQKNACNRQQQPPQQPGGEPTPIIESPEAVAMSSTALIRPKAVRMGDVPDVTRTATTSALDGREADAPISVEALFASATKGQKDKSRDPQHQSISPSPLSKGATNNPVLQKLLSDPGHLVEHIEREQRKNSTSKTTSTEPSHQKQTSAQRLEKDLKEKLKIQLFPEPSTPQEHRLPRNPSSNSPQLILTPAMLEQPQLPLTPVSHRPPPSQHVGISPDDLALPLSFETPPRLAAAPPKPAIPLMSPMMFTTSSTPSASKSVLSQTKPTTPATPTLHTPHQNGGGSSSLDAAEPATLVSPLTKKHFMQALVHLLKTDQNFLATLHEAYLDSLLSPQSLDKL